MMDDCLPIAHARCRATVAGPADAAEAAQNLSVEIRRHHQPPSMHSSARADSSQLSSTRTAHSLVAGNSGCPSVLMLDATGVAYGFGHHVTMLMMAIDVASKVGAQLALADSLWSGTGTGSGSQARGRGAYEWAWDLFPFQRASAVPACNSSLRKRDSRAAMAERLHANSTTALFHPPLACGECRHIHVGSGVSCDGAWCVQRFAGVYDRASALLRPYTHPRLASSLQLPSPPGSPLVAVCSHGLATCSQGSIRSQCVS